MVNFIFGIIFQFSIFPPYSNSLLQFTIPHSIFHHLIINLIYPFYFQAHLFLYLYLSISLLYLISPLFHLVPMSTRNQFINLIPDHIIFIIYFLIIYEIILIFMPNLFPIIPIQSMQFFLLNIYYLMPLTFFILFFISISIIHNILNQINLNLLYFECLNLNQMNLNMHLAFYILNHSKIYHCKSIYVYMRAHIINGLKFIISIQFHLMIISHCVLYLLYFSVLNQ